VSVTAVVTDNCQACRFTECVSVCPVACFHGDEQMLYIDPAACIDCCACVPVCPMQAIYMEDEMPPELVQWKDINAVRAAALPLVTRASAPLPTAEAKRASLGL
jgi:ferredoxin